MFGRLHAWPVFLLSFVAQNGHLGMFWGVIFWPNIDFSKYVDSEANAMQTMVPKDTPPTGPAGRQLNLEVLFLGPKKKKKFKCKWDGIFGQNLGVRT